MTMPKRRLTKPRTTGKISRSSARRTKLDPKNSPDFVSRDVWSTSITGIQLNKIVCRGYSLDELMGRVSFGETVFLLLTGELPTADVGRLVESLLVSAIDHGVTPPSTIAARNVATTGAPLRAAAAGGVLAFGSPLGGGGSIDQCFHFLDEGLGLVGDWVSFDDAARRQVDRFISNGQTPPGYGHRFHTRDPRAARLLQIALELELEGRYIKFLRAVERVLAERNNTSNDTPPCINLDGAIAAVSGDLGLEAETANVLFMISRLPGIVAHVIEEQKHQDSQRQIDPTNHTYDGPRERRLPETRR